MSFQKSVLFLREDPPPDAGGGKGFYDEPAPPSDSEPPAPPPPADPVPPVPPAATPPVVPPTEPPPPTTPPPATPLPSDWRKEVKTADHKEVLKEMGYDDFAIDLLAYGKKTGDYTPYLEAKTVDYTVMTPEQLIKMEMRVANKGMSERALEIKFNKEFSSKYCTDRTVYPADSDEAILGEEQLKLDTERLRAQFIEKQQSFKAPEPKPDTAAAQRTAQMQQQREQVSNLILTNEATTALKAAKSLTFTFEGEDSFNFEVPDVDSLVVNMQSLLANGERADLNGVDLKNLYKSMVIGSDPAKFLDLYGKHMRALEYKKLQNELTNATPPPDGGTPPPPNAPVQNKGFYDNIGKVRE